ncbi:S8 family serine peptidase [Sporosarcina sp. 179-K 3D1 HS]|uniref:S8 family peptidase n=1 Tax=Sporosarcina sp. 179-K 3D1 HS TaxID=3232169 RepID=UPI0039A22C74
MKNLFSSTLFLLVTLCAFPAWAEETDRVIVQVKDDQGNQTIESVLVEEIEDLDEADILQPDFIRSISLQESHVGSKSWGTLRIGAQRMKTMTSPIEGSVIVAIIDTGVDETHPFLKDRIVDGYDFINNDTNPRDVHFHGTHVAGIIVDTTPANVKIMPIRALDDDGKGYDSDIAKGIRFAVDNGADVINMSFAGEEYSPFLAEAIDYALSKNVPIIVSSGNESTDTENFYPASEEKIIVVSAIDQIDHIADFSNTGASIDVSAPGVNISSSVPGGQFASYSGTSMAAPFVSGIAAMFKLENPTQSVGEIEGLLKKYVDDRGAIGRDPLFGEGVVNVTGYDKNLVIDHEQVTVNKDKTAIAFVPFPEQRGVPLDAKWTITFDRPLTDGDVVDFKVFRGDKEVPITRTFNSGENEIMIAPLKPLLPHTTYRLLLFVEHGRDYEMKFVTGD